MRHLISAAALGGFVVLAFGSGSSSESSTASSSDSSTGADAATATAPPADDPSARLDAQLPPCPDGTTRKGGKAGAPGVPWQPEPDLLPPRGLPVNATPQAAETFYAPLKEAPRLVRWCETADGTPEGPAVQAAMDGSWRLFLQYRDGLAEGPTQGQSFDDADGDGFWEAPHEIELNGEWQGGRAHGAWSALCIAFDMTAKCPLGANVEGRFERGRRVGEWVWATEIDMEAERLVVPYVAGKPAGTAVFEDKVATVYDCRAEGPVDARGRQGTWTRTCTGRQVEPRSTSRWKDGSKVGG